MTASASEALTKEKLSLLARAYGQKSVEDLLEQFGYDEAVPGICMNPGCGYSNEYEPDQRKGWCEDCGTPSVASLLVLLNLI